MKHIKQEIKKGIKLHTIKTEKFKTNLIAIFLTTKLSKENVTKNALISCLLRRGSKSMPTQEEISKSMEEMYGASFDCGLEKTGDNHIFKFYIETINDNFLPETKNHILKTSLEKMLDIVFNPYIENDSFKKEYVEQEKNNIRQKLKGRPDNKARYSLDRCIEEMYPNEPFGIYKFGKIEDLDGIDEKNIYEEYLNLIDNCKIDIFISGNMGNEVAEIVTENENIKKLKERKPNFALPTLNDTKNEEEKVVTESMDVTQGKLVLGLDVNVENEDLKYDVLAYNSILGGTANSKMFQNVREKEHLAYVASSSYLRQKNNIFINCGIEIKNYEKALKVIKEQIEAMRQGDFSDEDIENAKKSIISTIKTIEDEQDVEISYYLGQELTTEKLTLEEYMQRIEKIKREDIINVANKTNINTIYFLKD